MPEGHTVHRTANQFNEFFAGKPINVVSPQGRFSESAQLISGRNLQEARAIGKQMFLLFDNQLTLRIHLGIYGKWNYHQLKNADSAFPEPVGQVRARFSNDQTAADLRGPTVCEVITKDEVKRSNDALGRIL